jgi:hypothetical protein
VNVACTVKKRFGSFVPSRDVTIELSLGGNNDVKTEYSCPGGVFLVSDIPAGDGKFVNLFLWCGMALRKRGSIRKVV